LKKKINKFDKLNESTINILNKDNLEEINHKYNYVERKKIENIDNLFLLNTVKKYNQDEKNFINEFNDIYVSQDNRED